MMYLNLVTNSYSQIIYTCTHMNIQYMDIIMYMGCSTITPYYYELIFMD